MVQLATTEDKIYSDGTIKHSFPLRCLSYFNEIFKWNNHFKS